MLALLAAQASPARAETLIADSGVGGLTEKSRYEYAAVSAALPGATVVNVVEYSEDTPVPALEARLRGERALLVFGNKRGLIDRVAVYTPQIATSKGTKVGTSFADAFEQEKPPKCARGIEQEAGQVFCPAAGFGRVHFAFKGRWQGPDNEVPPADVLAGWHLATIIWVAPD